MKRSISHQPTLLCKQTLVVLLATVSLASVTAQSSAVSDTAPMISRPSPLLPSANSTFVLGAGDQVTFRVQDMEEISDKSFRIDPDGNIDLPLLGVIRVAGLTLEQLKTELVARASKYVTSPQVSVTLSDNQNRQVSVIGEVNSPGIHQLAGSRSLVEVLSMAGGVKANAGSKVILTREIKWGPLPLSGEKTDVSGSYTTATVSLDDLLAAKNPADNIRILPNDVISVPKGDIVYVVGDVRRAGGFPLTSHETMTLLQALSLAEGLGPDAASQHAKILRPVPGSDSMPREIPVDVKKIFAGKASDMPLYANDILFIPNSAAKSGSRRAVEAILQVATGVAIYGR